MCTYNNLRGMMVNHDHKSLYIFKALPVCVLYSRAVWHNWHFGGLSLTGGLAIVQWTSGAVSLFTYRETAMLSSLNKTGAVSQATSLSYSLSTAFSGMFWVLQGDVILSICHDTTITVIYLFSITI